MAFPEIPDLVTRGRADGLGGLYVQMAERGELRLYPGRVVPVGAFFADVARALPARPWGRPRPTVAAARRPSKRWRMPGWSGP